MIQHNINPLLKAISSVDFLDQTLLQFANSIDVRQILADIFPLIKSIEDQVLICITQRKNQENSDITLLSSLETRFKELFNLMKLGTGLVSTQITNLKKDLDLHISNVSHQIS
jgi:hypothetical protein